MEEKNVGGRPMLGGKRRRSVRVAGPNYTGMPLSMLPEQAAFLERVGGGNRSKGFRLVIALLSHTARVFPLIECAVTGFSEDPDRDAIAVTDINGWLAVVDRILEHGRENAEDSQEADGS